MIARAQGRRRWRAALALTLFVGLAGGLATALVAGGRRSSTVVDRYFAPQTRYQASVVTQTWGPTRAQVRGLPGITRADPAAYVAFSVVGRDGEVVGGTNGQAIDFAALDPTFRVLEGTMPGPADPTGIAVNPFFAHEYGVRVGDRVRLRTFGIEQADDVSAGIYAPDGPEYEFRVRAIGRTPDDIAVGDAETVGDSGYGSASVVAVQDAWYQAHRREFLDFPGIYNVQIRPGTSRGALTTALTALTPDGADPGIVVPPQVSQRADALTTPVDVETAALLLLGAGIGMAAVVAVALVLRTEQRLHDTDTPTLRALGGTRRLLGLVAVRRALPVAVGGAVLAVAIALVLSARFPIGIGRRLEPDPGFRVDGWALATGAVGVVLVVLGLAYAFGVLRPDRIVKPRRPRSVAGVLARMGAPGSATIAAHLAFGRSGGRRTPSRGTIAGGALLLAVVTGIGVYVSGVDHAFDDPAAHGFPWDAAIGNTNFTLQPDTAQRVAADRRVTAVSDAEFGSVLVEGEYSEVLVYDPKGTAPPQVLSGRLPVRASEVALGTSTQRKTGARIGSTVELAFVDSESGDQPPPQRFTVVGTALAPVFGDADIGDVGILTFAGAESLGAPTDPQLVLTRLESGGSPEGIRALDRAYTEEIATDMVPARVETVRRVQGVPRVGLAIAAAMAVFVLAYALALSVRVRNRDLAILRAMGMSVRGVRRIIGWLGVLFATGIVVIGVPLGVLIGSATWRSVADGIGIATTIHVSPYLWLAVPATFAVALVAAWAGGRRVGRHDVTTLLRPE